jgi:hypothetical protein
MAPAAANPDTDFRKSRRFMVMLQRPWESRLWNWNRKVRAKP